MRTSVIFGGLAALVLPAASRSLSKRAVINHDAVVGFPETVPDGIVGELYLKYKPLLKVFNGCVSFPGVDADGNTSGGLKPTGEPSGDCDSSPGQVYGRAAEYDGSYAIMYAWYMPKDSPASGMGHRHDWEHVVIWLSAGNASATVEGVAVSQHGLHEKDTSPPMKGDTPLIGYKSYWPLNHQMIFTDEVGGEQPLIAWESLTDAARTALSETDFGSGNVPMKDASFEDKLESAKL